MTSRIEETQISERAERLRLKFGEQVAFAAGYSPLYARLFNVVEGVVGR